MRRVVLAILVSLVGTTAMRADSLVTIEPTGTDSVVWSQLGPSHTAIPNPFDFTTTNSIDGIGSYAGAAGEAIEQGNGWTGNFTPGDSLNWTFGQGPLTLTFDQGYTQIGAQIQSDFLGAFTAQICDENDNVCFTENGNSTTSSDGSAIFIGIESATPITSVTFALTAAPSTPGDFAIDTVILDSGGSVAPEPNSLLLFGTGIVGLAGLIRRKFAKAL